MIASARSWSGFVPPASTDARPAPPHLPQAGHRPPVRWEPLPPGVLVPRADLLASGVTPGRIRRALDRGALREPAPRVYVQGPPGPHEPVRAHTVSLRGVASFGSAAGLWGIETVRPDPRLHVTIPRARWNPRRTAVVLHRADLGAGEAARARDVPVTSVIRTLRDLSAALPLPEAVIAVDSALRARLVTPASLVGACGALARAVVLADAASGSVLESLCRVLLVQAGWPPERTQLRIGAIRVDFAWPSRQLVVEVDGFAFHADRAAYRADRRRTNALVLEGWRVLRFSYEDVTRRPEHVLASVRTALLA